MNIFKLFGLLLSLTIFSNTTFAEEQKPLKVKVGALLTLSGNFATAGQDCQRGIDAALSENGASDKLQIVYADSKNEPPAAINEFKKLVEYDHVSAIYLNRAAIGMPINPLAKQAKIPLIGAVGHNAFVPENPFTYQAWPSAQAEAEFLAGEFIKQGLKKVAMVYSEDEWTQSVASAFHEIFPKHGGTFVFEQSVLTPETDFRSVLTKVKRTDPDALYFNVVISQIGPLFRQAYELKLTGERFSNFYVAKKEVIEAAGAKVVEGIQYADINTTLPHLHKKLGLAEGELIPPMALVSYVATTLLARAANEASDTSASAIAAALEKQDSIRMVDASYNIQGRYIILPLTLRRLDSK